MFTRKELLRRRENDHRKSKRASSLRHSCCSQPESGFPSLPVLLTTNADMIAKYQYTLSSEVICTQINHYACAELHSHRLQVQVAHFFKADTELLASRLRSLLYPADERASSDALRDIWPLVDTLPEELVATVLAPAPLHPEEAIQRTPEQWHATLLCANPVSYTHLTLPTTPYV